LTRNSSRNLPDPAIMGGDDGDQVALLKRIRNKLCIKTGDQFGVEVSGTQIVLTPVVTVSKEQAWFWTDEIQAKV